jgi:hypothetical protein
MQLRKMMLVLTALGAMSGFMVGCGDEEGTSNTCSTNDDCAGTEICHPTAGVCVTTCESGSDCPNTAKTCAPLGGTGADAATKICQCSTDVLCNGGTDSDSTDMVCSDLDNVCVTKCTADSDCSGDRTCNTGSGQCEEGDVTPTTCSGTGKSTCAYGDFCSNSTCTDAPVAPTTCENFSTNRPNWNATSSTGPVIYEVSGITYQTNSSYCAASAPDAFIVRVRAYRTDTDWPATRSGLSGFFYVNTGATSFDVVGSGLLVPNTGYNRNTSNPRDAEFQVYLCRPSNSQTIQTGFYFTGGNPVCQQVNR